VPSGLFCCALGTSEEGGSALSKSKRPISDRERSRRDRQREQSIAGVEKLLYSRQQTAYALGGISIATVQRMENALLLDKVRPLGSRGAVFHRVEQVHALANKSEAT
jgi:hypothetical protein